MKIHWKNRWEKLLDLKKISSKIVQFQEMEKKVLKSKKEANKAVKFQKVLKEPFFKKWQKGP